ncbi:cytokinin-O-glucosyltransferase 2 isoform 2 [Zea mays]|uniref:Uncharacterized protein n=1 Tax=Zea mays TaxID=4577 RepID=C0P4M6_MAIZE|nr:cytokinin-O-glucosyltransferase 2 isoform 2 [Zea mays]ACN27942.1 unknown [Zea mays]
MARPHVVVVPYPCSGNINPALQIARLLHRHGVYVTFVNTEHNHRRVQATEGAGAVRGGEGFRFEAIPDGLSEAERGKQDYGRSLAVSTSTRCAAPLRDLIARLNGTPGVPPVTCVLPTMLMSFALGVARELGIPTMSFWTASAASLMTHMRLRELQERGREFPDERLPRDDGHRLDPRGAADPPRRLLELPPHHRPGRLRSALQRVGGEQLRQGRRPHPQHLRRPRGRRARRAARRVPARVHRRAPGPAPPPGRRPRQQRLRQRQHRVDRPEPVEAGRRVPRLAGRARAGLRRVRQLRQPHGGDAGAAERVRVGPRGERPPVPLVHEGQPRPRRRRRRPGRDALDLQG